MVLGVVGGCGKGQAKAGVSDVDKVHALQAKVSHELQEIRDVCLKGLVEDVADDAFLQQVGRPAHKPRVDEGDFEKVLLLLVEAVEVDAPDDLNVHHFNLLLSLLSPLFGLLV